LKYGYPTVNLMLTIVAKHMAFTDSLEWRSRWFALVSKITRVGTAVEKAQLIDHLCRPQSPKILAFANAHALNYVVGSSAFFNSLGSADCILRDGSGMATLFRLLKLEPGLNLNGTDLIPMLIEHFNGRPMAIFGTQSPYLEQGLEAIMQKLAPASDCIKANGFQQSDLYVKMALANKPELIVLGMGMPKQEKIAADLRAALTHPCLIVCGGAIIDFLGGKTRRAPLWMRRFGLEWLFRLGMEPKRLFYRYVIGNPTFIARAFVLANTPLQK
jgi:N-acetylglucosaminyldiphosphoundecaprenol N-acetyl-beta-D-mannosaminyltransferase